MRSWEFFPCIFTPAKLRRETSLAPDNWARGDGTSGVEGPAKAGRQGRYIVKRSALTATATSRSIATG